MTTPFVPDDFHIPAVLETDQLRLRMLSVDDLEKDYDAVMTSIEHLHIMFPYDPWPDENMTLEEDLEDLEWHQKEFETRSSFAYTVMNPDESECLGCVYIYPTEKPGFDAKVYVWVRKSEFDKGLDSILFNTVKQWVAREWPFKNVAYPGREIDWATWGPKHS